MADIEQAEQMIPLITCEISFGQYVFELVFGVNAFDLDFGSKLNLSNNELRTTLWVLETCLIVGLLPFLIISLFRCLQRYTTKLEDWTFEGVFLVIRPNPTLHFAPFLSTHFYPCLSPMFKYGSFLSVVALVSVTLLDSNPRPLRGKKIELGTDSSSLARTTTIELPECQERRGQKQ